MNVQLRLETPAEAANGVRRLGEARRGDRGVVVSVSAEDLPTANAIERDELERRLLEIGFVEGARIEVLHEGFLGRDPIAVRLDDMRVALRRREAQGVLIQIDDRARTSGKASSGKASA